MGGSPEGRLATLRSETVLNGHASTKRREVVQTMATRRNEGGGGDLNDMPQHDLHR